MFFGIVEGEAGDARRGLLGDDLQAFDDAGHDFVLEAGVEIFGIFADDDDVYAIEVGFYAGQVFDRAQIGVEVETFAQCHVDAGRAAGDCCGHWAFQGYAVAADGVNRGGIQHLAADGAFVGVQGAGVEVFPVDLYAGSFENALGGSGNFGTNSFARQ